MLRCILTDFVILQYNSRSITPSPSPKHSVLRPQALVLQRTRGVVGKQNVGQAATQNPNTLHPLSGARNQLLLSSRQASSNASEGGYNRESSLDDSGVVDDHEEQEVIESCMHIHKGNEVVSLSYVIHSKLEHYLFNVGIKEA